MSYLWNRSTFDRFIIQRWWNGNMTKSVTTMASSHNRIVYFSLYHRNYFPFSLDSYSSQIALFFVIRTRVASYSSWTLWAWRKVFRWIFYYDCLLYAAFLQLLTRCCCFFSVIEDWRRCSRAPQQWWKVAMFIVKVMQEVLIWTPNCLPYRWRHGKFLLVRESAITSVKKPLKKKPHWKAFLSTSSDVRALFNNFSSPHDVIDISLTRHSVSPETWDRQELFWFRCFHWGLNWMFQIKRHEWWRRSDCTAERRTTTVFGRKNLNMISLSLDSRQWKTIKNRFHDENWVLGWKKRNDIARMNCVNCKWRRYIVRARERTDDKWNRVYRSDKPKIEVTVTQREQREN